MSPFASLPNRAHLGQEHLVPEQRTKDDQIRLDVAPNPRLVHDGQHDLLDPLLERDRSLLVFSKPIGGFRVYHTDPDEKHEDEIKGSMERPVRAAKLT